MYIKFILSHVFDFVLEHRITARDALNHPWFAAEAVIGGLPLVKFQRNHCHAFILRKDRERYREAQRQQHQAGYASQAAASSIQTRRQGPR